MANETVARRYAQAIFELAKETSKVDVVLHDLETVVATLKSDETVRRFFRAPIIDKKEKTEIIGRAFSMLDKTALNSVLLLIRKRREGLLEPILEQYRILHQAARNAQSLKISSARELSSDELKTLVGRLGKLYNTQFDVTQDVDPSLIGGIRITMGDKRIDGSVSGKLEELARTLSTN